MAVKMGFWQRKIVRYGLPIGMGSLAGGGVLAAKIMGVPPGLDGVLFDFSYIAAVLSAIKVGFLPTAITGFIGTSLLARRGRPVRAERDILAGENAAMKEAMREVFVERDKLLGEKIALNNLIGQYKSKDPLLQDLRKMLNCSEQDLVPAVKNLLERVPSPAKPSAAAAKADSSIGTTNIIIGDQDMEPEDTSPGQPSSVVTTLPQLKPVPSDEPPPVPKPTGDQTRAANFSGMTVPNKGALLPVKEPDSTAVTKDKIAKIIAKYKETNKRLGAANLRVIFGYFEEKESDLEQPEKNDLLDIFTKELQYYTQSPPKPESKDWEFLFDEFAFQCQLLGVQYNNLSLKAAAEALRKKAKEIGVV